MPPMTCLKCDRDISKVDVIFGVLKCPECGTRYKVAEPDKPPFSDSNVPGTPGPVYGSSFISTAGVSPNSNMNIGMCPKCGSRVNGVSGQCSNPSCGYVLSALPIHIGT